MKVYNANLKVYRFDFNIDILKTKPLLNIKYEIVMELYPASDGKKDACKYGLRIATHCIEINSNKEAVGYLSEYFSDFVIENLLLDFPHINRFVENAFLNHENYFQENKPKEVILGNLIVNPNVNQIAENIFAQLKKEGYYN
jgi:hypothetical protein